MTDGLVLVEFADNFVVWAIVALALLCYVVELDLLLAERDEAWRRRAGTWLSVLPILLSALPLLGLLGTVTGMMGSFSLIGGELSAPGAITGGIAEALIATAFGLGIAITALLPFNFLNSRLDEATHDVESAAAQLELLVQSHVPARARVQAQALEVG